MNIKIDDLTSPEIIALLAEHLASTAAVSPPESQHALDVAGLRQPAVTFWSIWDNGELAGCAALKELDPAHGELKSMRTARPHLRKGVARTLLQHLMAEAKRRGYRRISLETGSMEYFEPARALYRSFGFATCQPFGDYVLDPNSVFMSIEL
jgi:putative acetyltransferase